MQHLQEHAMYVQQAQMQQAQQQMAQQQPQGRKQVNVNEGSNI